MLGLIEGGKIEFYLQVGLVARGECALRPEKQCWECLGEQRILIFHF
jgi:hypothetical protein